MDSEPHDGETSVVEIATIHHEHLRSDLRCGVEMIRLGREWCLLRDELFPIDCGSVDPFGRRLNHTGHGILQGYLRYREQSV